MLPLNYAILSHFTKVEEASVVDIMEALKEQYGSYSAFKKNAIQTALLVAKVNLIIEESYFDFDEEKELRVFYRITADGRDMIEKYVNK